MYEQRAIARAASDAARRSRNGGATARTLGVGRPRAASTRAPSRRRGVPADPASGSRPIEPLEARVFFSVVPHATNVIEDLSTLPGAADRYVVDRSLPGGVILRGIDRDSVPVHTLLAKGLTEAGARDQNLEGTDPNPVIIPGGGGGGGSTPTTGGSGLKIVLKQGSRLKANAVAAAAFRRAADFVQTLFSDNLTIVIDAEIAPLGSGLIGQTSAVDVQFDYVLFDEVRDLLIGDAASDEQIVRRLPNQDQLNALLPPDTSRGFNPFVVAGIGGSRANFRAMGMHVDMLADGPYSAYDRTVKRDMSMTFSSNFAFDYDRADGIGAGKMDFTGVVIHEIAHGLGFLSEVDTVDQLLGEPNAEHLVYPNPLDLFRLKPGAGASNFTTAQRVLTSGKLFPNQVFYDGGVYDPVAAGFTTPGLKRGDIPMATGVDRGDGQQASHWKDADDSGVYVGSLDPSAAPGSTIEWTENDTRAMGLIGWDVVKTTATVGSVSGVAFNDSDGDGVRDANETGRANVGIYVDANDNGSLDAAERSTKTDTGGAYRFTSLPPGTYTVRAILPVESRLTIPLSGAHAATIAAGQNLGGFNFGTGAVSSTPTLPAPWTARDIGAVGLAGGASLTGTTYTVRGAGADIFGNADSFQFTSQPLKEDGEIVARVALVGGVDPFAKAGVMIRQGTGADATNAALVVTRGQGLRFTTRSTTGGSTATVKAAGSGPTWLRLVRGGTRFTAYRSAEGTKWTLVGTRTIATTGDLLIGLAVTSHNTAVLNTSSFDNVRVTRPVKLRSLRASPVSTTIVPWMRAPVEFEESNEGVPAESP